jgi:hypothetical protein
MTGIVNDDAGCGNCDSPVNSDAAHAACGHGYMTGCPDCGDFSTGGYFLASDPRSGPPCQAYISELETGILAGNHEYVREYEDIKARWSDIRVFTEAIRSGYHLAANHPIIECRIAECGWPGPGEEGH